MKRKGILAAVAAPLFAAYLVLGPASVASAEPGPQRVTTTKVYYEQGNRCEHTVVLARTSTYVTATSIVRCAQPTHIVHTVLMRVGGGSIQGADRACWGGNYCAVSFIRSNPAGTQSFYAWSPAVAQTYSLEVPGSATATVSTWG